MRKLKDINKSFYNKRIWNDGDIDYFKVVETAGGSWLYQPPYIRYRNNEYYSIIESIDERNIPNKDPRVIDIKIRKETFEEIKKLI